MLRALISRPIGSTQLAVSCWSAIDNSINAPIQFSRVTNHSISQLGQLQHRNWCFYYLIQKLLLLYIFWRQHERPLVGRWRNSEQTSPIKAQPRAALLLIDLFSLAYLLSRALDRSNLESSLSLSRSLDWDGRSSSWLNKIGGCCEINQLIFVFETFNFYHIHWNINLAAILQTNPI